jgi:CheY-like chemotaxis protein
MKKSYITITSMNSNGNYIIIVDDDEDDIAYMETLLLESGISTFLSFLSGEDLIDHLDSVKLIPALIILDYNMPRLKWPGSTTTHPCKRYIPRNPGGAAVYGHL